MNTNPDLTPENFREVLTSQPKTLQHGFVKGFSNLLISQPQDIQPPVPETDALLYLKLDIEPDSSSDIIVLYIRFEAEHASYAPVRYGNKNGNASKPISHYAAIMDLLRSGETGSKRTEIFLQVNADGRNALVIL
jgi:hypothetical protein